MKFDEAPVYFVLRADEGSKEQGPMSVREIRARVSSGSLKRKDWYARSGMAEWKLIFELLEAAQQVQTPPPVPPVLPQPDAPPMIQAGVILNASRSARHQYGPGTWVGI